MPPDDAGHPMDPQHIFLDGRLDPTDVVDKVDGVSFLPGANEIFAEDGGDKLNMWTPTDVIAAPGRRSALSRSTSGI